MGNTNHVVRASQSSFPLVGIDPGLKGAITVVLENCVIAYPMPVIGKTVSWEGVRDILVENGIRKVFLEIIWDNRKLIEGVGVVRAACVAHNVEVIEIGSQAWQLWAYGKMNGGNKGLSLAWCQKKGFNMNVLNTADKCEALIMAMCGSEAQGYSKKIQAKHITRGGGVHWSKAK